MTKGSRHHELFPEVQLCCNRVPRSNPPVTSDSFLVSSFSVFPSDVINSYNRDEESFRRKVMRQAVLRYMKGYGARIAASGCNK
jgi:hypothetical protein